jgi:Na+/proline symporter
MPYLARALLHPALAGVLISGAIAAMMSTADSQLLVTTSAVAEDVVHRMINPALEQKSLVLITRLTTLAVVFWLLSWRSNPRPWCFAWSGTLGPAWALPSDRRCC